MEIVSKLAYQVIEGWEQLPGDFVHRDVSDVAVDSDLRIAAVAANAGGLHLVNVADPMLPARLLTIPGTVNQVEVINGVAYAATWSSRMPKHRDCSAP